MFDYDSRTTYKAPDINVDFFKNAAKFFTNPSIENMVNTVKSGSPDPLMGEHNMQGTYLHSSGAMDFF